MKLDTECNSTQSGEEPTIGKMSTTKSTTQVGNINSLKMTTQYNSIHTDGKLAMNATKFVDSVKMKTQHEIVELVSEPMTAINSSQGKNEFQSNSQQDRTHMISGVMESVNKSKVCVWMTALFVISWGPYTMHNLICKFTGYEWTINVTTVFVGLASANSVFNPIIYFAKRETFRRYFQRF